MLNYVAVSDRGMVHQTNDDAALIDGFLLQSGQYGGESEKEDGLFAVADGVGAMEGSALASKLALETLRSAAQEITELSIRDIIRQANSAIVGAIESGAIGPIGTTLTGVYIHGSKLLTFNVGNSRVYRFRDGFLQQLTLDHSITQSMINEGNLSPHSARTHNQKHIITRYLGTTDTQSSMPDIEWQPLSFKSSDCLLLCSDGLMEHLSIEDIEKVLSGPATLREKCLELLIESNGRGGYDNTTAVLVTKV